MAPSKPKLSTTEFNSLHDFYNATNGPCWRWHNVTAHSVPWNFSIPHVNPCFASWQGLHCSCGLTTCSVSMLVLDHHNLSGYLPDSMRNFGKVTVLNLRGNNISSTITASIGNMTSLELLDISNNFLTGPIPSMIGALSSLKILNLNVNLLTYIPDSLYELTNLLDLSIGFNNIRNAISSKIGNLRNVENLFLLENYFHSPLPDTVGNLTHLRVINLRRANLFGTIPKQLYQCRNLTGINLKFNHLTGSIHTDLGKLVNLVSYDISSNNIFGPIPDSIGELKSLTALVIDSNALSQTIPGTITQLPLLRDLILQKNSFSGDASVFTNMTSIRSFYISYNFFSTNFRFYSSEVFRELIYFSISANLMTGKLPWDGENWGRALFVYLTDKNYFTGELPTNYNSINKLLYFVVESNALWGTVPSNFLQKDNITYFIDLASNYFSGKLPEFFGNKTTLTQILLYENYFVGSIPQSFCQLRKLVVLDVSYNQLTGTIPPLLQELHLMEELLIESNQFTGRLDNFLNASKALRLVNVDVSDNQFTGSIPVAIFQKAKRLQSFAASRNCLDGFIPTEICEVENLQSLSLDGVTTSTSCKDMIFGDIPYFNGFIASHYLQGTIPSCLYEIPSLQLLHISGNSLTGTIPTGLNLSSFLTDLSLSHNTLIGSIPNEIQQREWINLDLSYNKLSGVLISNFSAIPLNGQLNLQVNRLSGNIPSNLLLPLNISQSIDILNGNIFACDTFKNNLPSNDPNYEKYSCGSDNVNNVLYAWIIAIVCIPLILLMLCKLTLKIFQFSKQSFERFSGKLKRWRTSLTSNTERIHIQRLSVYFQEMRLTSVYLAFYSVFILIPIYSVLKLYSASYSVEYAWSISGILNFGKSAAVITFLTLFIFALLYFYLLKRVLVNIDKKVPFQKEKFQEKRNSKIPLFDRALVYLLVCLINLIIMSFVDFSYVYTVLNYSASVVTFSALALALFRLLTNNIILWFALPLVYELILMVKTWCTSSTSFARRNAARLDPDYYSSSDISFIENIILFNNIIIPGLAIIFILPDCFYNALFAADNVQSSYTYESCYQYVGVLSYGHECSQFTETTEYSPPFIYSYQCSSKIVANYVPVYVLMFILAGIVIPFLKISLKLVYDSLQEKNNPRMKRTRRFIEFFLPEYFRAFENAIIPALSETGDSFYPQESMIAGRTLFTGKDKKRQLFSKLTMTVQVNSYLTILMCFGALFPPLALIAALSIFSITYFEELWIGWVLTHTRELGLGFGWYEEQIERECEGVEESSNLTIWSTLFVSCGLYAYMIFDTMGDTAGWRGALPMTLLMAFLPLLFWVGLNLWNKFGKLREIGNGTPKTPHNTEIETGVADKVNVDADDDEARVSKIELMDRGVSSHQEFVNNPIKPNHIKVKDLS